MNRECWVFVPGCGWRRISWWHYAKVLHAMDAHPELVQGVKLATVENVDRPRPVDVFPIPFVLHLD